MNAAQHECCLFYALLSNNLCCFVVIKSKVDFRLRPNSALDLMGQTLSIDENTSTESLALFEPDYVLPPLPARRKTEPSVEAVKDVQPPRAQTAPPTPHRSDPGTKEKRLEVPVLIRPSRTTPRLAVSGLQTKKLSLLERRSGSHTSLATTPLAMSLSNFDDAPENSSESNLSSQDPIMSPNSTKQAQLLVQLVIRLSGANYIPQWLARLSGTNAHISVTESFAFICETEKHRIHLQTRLSVIATTPINKRLNRYTDIVPFDQNRVKLLYGDHDYINASYLNAVVPVGKVFLRVNYIQVSTRDCISDISSNRISKTNLEKSIPPRYQNTTNPFKIM